MIAKKNKTRTQNRSSLRKKVSLMVDSSYLAPRDGFQVATFKFGTFEI